MGYAHGIKWDVDKIINGIKDVQRHLGITRMPSRTEIEGYYGNSSLTNKISKSGGFYRYAELLGLEIKESETAIGTKVENLIRELLISLGYDAERTDTRFPYDLLVNKRVKIDVKAGRLFTGGSSPYYTFNLEKKFQTCDFYVAVTLTGDDEIKDIFVIPSSVLSGKTQLSIGVNKSIYDKYKGRWDLVNSLDYSLGEIEKVCDL